MWLLIFTTLLATASAYAQITSCSTVPSDVATQLSEMEAFNNRVPPPSSINLFDCITAKSLQSTVNSYRTALPEECSVIYTLTTLTDGFNTQKATLDQFVTACGSL
ncbi:hypothetical protein DFH06DRAFT_1168378 [Mycena polygramma]|nr:hypothetical protein DFH06DRAFT_1168378 [Mycena polygramma]